MSATITPEVLAQFIAPAIGNPAWAVKQGHGSFITLEFGNATSDSDRQHGEVHCWIYCCHWRVSGDGTALACSEDDRDKIAAACAAIDGQTLRSITMTSKAGCSRFEFDGGILLETWPYGDDPTVEQWMLYRRNRAFAYRADGCYSEGPSNLRSADARWLPIEGPV